MPFHVYILKCQNDQFYVGLTQDLRRRTQDHLSGYGSKYTKEEGVEKLVYYETHDSKSAAAKREKQLKGWSRAKKLALINSNQTQLKKLSISRQSPRFVQPS